MALLQTNSLNDDADVEREISHLFVRCNVLNAQWMLN